MDLHQNARLTFRSRETLANQIMIEKVTLKAVAAAFKVSRKTAAKWVHRYRTLGLPGLRDRSSRPSIARAEPRRSGSLSHRPASPVATRLSHRASHRPQPHHRQSYSAARAVEPLASSASRSARRALRVSAPGDLLHLDIKGMTRYQQVSIRGDGRRRGRPQLA